ncbi:MAG: GWxTD domain-containing protein [Bacteroidetes bacterium]|nr:GWxTD domain-containing protein [Bacteroidota bacterium]
MKHIYFFFLFFLPGLVFPQDKFDFEFDYAQFGYDSTSNYVEFYYSFNQLSLTINHKDTIDYTEGILHITIEDTSTGELQVNQDWLISHIVKDSLNLSKSLVGVIGFILNGGIYKCDIIGKDAIDPEKKRSITEILEVKPFYQLGIAMGDIQLASNIVQGSDNTSSIFYKNTFEIMPIPTSTFGENQPVLFYYTELYNVKSKDDGKLRIDEHVINSKGQIVNQKSKLIGRSLDSRVEVGTVMTYKLPTDTYTLVLSLIDSAANYGISSSKKFFVYNPSVEYVDTFKTQGSNLVVGMFGVMSEEELDDFFAKSRYIASMPEIEKYENLTTENAKAKFLTNFWKVRDEDPSDNMNHYLKDYMRRIKESNIKYKALSREGWKTDRGRVYLVYGQPSEIDRYPNQIDTRPYEIWNYYDIEGGVQFIFGDITGFSDYMLLHSTKRGELRDDGWQRRIVIR